MPDNFCESPEGLLFISNGMDRVLRWDGLTYGAEPAGLTPPTTAPTLGSSGLGAIIGTYYAYVRFLDKDGNYSNFSPISNEHTPASRTGALSGATNATPIVVTSAGHGLTSGTTVKIEGVGGAVGANGTFVITVVDPDTFSLNDTVSSGDYTGGGTWTSGVDLIIYTSVPIPVEPRAVRRQVLRNLDGDATTFYVDVDTTDLGATTFESRLTDEDLGAKTAQALLTANGLPLANRYTVPPTHKAVLAHHLGRMFAAVEITYDEGSVAVVTGSPTVQGIATEWTEAMASRYLYVIGAQRSYQIQSVNTTAQTLTLTGPYRDVTNPYARYGIRPPPAERRLVYYSEAGLPEAWPLTNALDIQEDADEITGLMVNGSFLYILERRHIYRFTFQGDPATDGFVFLNVNGRGCINNRCWVRVEGTVFMLDEQGIHAFDGGAQVEPLSTPIQDFFRKGDGRYTINWRNSRFFHAVHFPSQEVIRWFVCLSGEYLPRSAICFNHRLKRFWVEQFAFDVGASCEATLDSERCVVLGCAARRVVKFWHGTLDGPDKGAGTVRGTVTSAAPLSLTDDFAEFATARLVNAPLVIVHGPGQGQVRKVVAVSGKTLKIDSPWTQQPDNSSVYQLGGIPWMFRTGLYGFTEDEQFNPRRVRVYFSPLGTPGEMVVRLFKDYEVAPEVWQTGYSSEEADGIKSEAGSPNLTVDLTMARGQVVKSFSGHKEYLAIGETLLQVELSGVVNEEQVAIYELDLEGASGG